MSFARKLILGVFGPKEICTDYVDLSIGRVYIKPLNHGNINRVAAKSTIAGTVLNNALYFNLIESELVKLNGKTYDTLSLEDGNKLREKIKEILKRHGLLNDEIDEEEFSSEEKTEFERQEKELIDKLKRKA